MKNEQMVEVFKRCGIVAADNGDHVNVKQNNGTWLKLYPAQWTPADLHRHLIARGAKPL